MIGMRAAAPASQRSASARKSCLPTADNYTVFRVYSPGPHRDPCVQPHVIAMLEAGHRAG
jgi:hypothetical protein